jgi:hypothetical protein
MVESQNDCKGDAWVAWSSAGGAACCIYGNGVYRRLVMRTITKTGIDLNMGKEGSGI